MRTFDEFLDHLDLSPSVLSDRLAVLTREGIFRRAPNPKDGRSVEYRLTEKGIDLYPIIVAMLDWGERWAPSKKGTRIRLVEKANGEQIQGAKVVSQSGHFLTPYDVETVAGPGADAKIKALVGNGSLSEN